MSESEKTQEEMTQDQTTSEIKQETTENDAVETENESTKTEISAEERILILEKENAELKDQLLRRAADFDNYRKRMIKEKQETFDYANANLLGDLLESLDNFDRSLEAADTAKDVKSMAEGIKMINKNLVKMLEDKYNLVSYGKVGDEFNPDEHQAIGSSEGDVKEPTIKEVYLKGYKLKEKIIRHAKVMVVMPGSN
jgi:molecular chaperone GrpE